MSNFIGEEAESNQDISGVEMASLYDPEAMSARDPPQYGTKSLFSIKRIFEERAKQCGTERNVDLGGTFSTFIMGKTSQDEVSR